MLLESKLISRMPGGGKAGYISFVLKGNERVMNHFEPVAPLLSSLSAFDTILHRVMKWRHTQISFSLEIHFLRKWNLSISDLPVRSTADND